MYSSIAPAIESEVVELLHKKASSQMKYEGQVMGSWLIHLVIVEFLNRSPEIDLTPDYVSALLWEQIQGGSMDIDKYGMVSVVSPSAL